MARILVVEDELDQLAVRRQLLEHAGYDVFSAQTCSEAIERLPGCDLVLTDLRIPRLEDGVELIRVAKAAGARVIVLSGAQSDLPLDADEFLVKPSSSKKLLETVARFCGSAQGT